MTNLESQTRLEVVLDLTKSPKELIAEIRAGIFRVTNSLVLTAQKGEIAINSADLERVIGFVRSKIPNVVFSNDGKKITFSESSYRAETVNTHSAEAPVTPQTRQFEPNDDTEDLYGHHGEWDSFNRELATAREAASIANRTSDRRNRISVNQFGFSYRGRTISLLANGERQRSSSELRNWRNIVDHNLGNGKGE
ncbi:MAG: hypothetical protein PHP74_00105 [Candidatus Gracilibacteria bacterium]|nr:hypothetical protein [Candidatus Gracilibacteria bacterium]